VLNVAYHCGTGVRPPSIERPHYTGEKPHAVLGKIITRICDGWPARDIWPKKSAAHAIT
jgi:hypothetical protein